MRLTIQGGRASGKTYLLNLITDMARQHGYAVSEPTIRQRPEGGGIASESVAISFGLRAQDIETDDGA